jgi:hypothetical protein
MLVRLLAAVPFYMLLAPGATIHAQTQRIETEVEVKLWLSRLLQRIEDSAGVPPTVSLLLPPISLVVFAALVWLWYVRRKRRK